MQKQGNCYLRNGFRNSVKNGLSLSEAIIVIANYNLSYSEHFFFFCIATNIVVNLLFMRTNKYSFRSGIGKYG